MRDSSTTVVQFCPVCRSEYQPPFTRCKCGISGALDGPPSILQQAQETISERGEQYGDAKEVFDTTAAMFNAWNAVWSGDGEFGATGVAVFNICQKLARIAHGESDIDNWRDIIGYAALGAEIEE